MDSSLIREDPIILTEYASESLVLNINELEIIKTNLHKYIQVKQSMKIDQDRYLCTIQAIHYVGMLKVSDSLNIVLQPKIPAVDFLQMLTYVEPRYAVIYQDIIDKLREENNFLQTFLKSFLEKTESLMLNNLRRGYSHHSRIDRIPRGKINIPKSLNIQDGVIPKFWIAEYRFNSDTIHNQVIKYTLEYIQKSIQGNLIPIYRRLLHYLEETTVRPWMPTEIEGISYNRLNYGYKEIHLLCLMILQDFTIQLEIGKKKFFSFVLNSWNVYEDFLRKIFQKFQRYYKVDAYKIPHLSQDIDWDMKGRPDILLHSTHGGIIVIDAKYKNRPYHSDENQMYRYLGEFNTDIGYLIYPKSQNLQEDNEIPIRQRDREVMIHYKIIDLSKITDDEYRKEFVSRIVDTELVKEFQV
jgi:5-methylcytosine-specific restriction endonuclease McrBC regulatory subunit McrC